MFYCPNCPPNRQKIDGRGVCMTCGYQIPHMEDVGSPPPPTAYKPFGKGKVVVGEGEAPGVCVE